MNNNEVDDIKLTKIDLLRNELNDKLDKLAQKMFVKKDAYLMFGFGIFILLCIGYFATDKLALLIQLIKAMH